MKSAQSESATQLENIMEIRGKSFSMICCWSAIVCVATTSCLLNLLAAIIPGTRYAMLLPTPVPASKRSGELPENACAQQYAIRSCSGLCSKLGSMEAYPPLPKIFSQSGGRARPSKASPPSGAIYERFLKLRMCFAARASPPNVPKMSRTALAS